MFLVCSRVQEGNINTGAFRWECTIYVLVCSYVDMSARVSRKLRRENFRKGSCSPSLTRCGPPLLQKRDYTPESRLVDRHAVAACER